MFHGNKHSPSHVYPAFCSHHHPQSLSERKEIKIIEHFTNERIGEGSRDNFIKLIEKEIEPGTSLFNLKCKLDYMNKYDPAMKKIYLSEKLTDNKDFIKFLLSDISPKQIKFFVHPEECGWAVNNFQTHKKQKVAKKRAAPKKISAPKV